MMIVRTLAVAATVLAMVAPVFAGSKPGSVGTGTGTATTTSGSSSAQMPPSGQPATSSVTPQGGTGTATGTAASGTSASGKIGQGTTK